MSKHGANSVLKNKTWSTNHLLLPVAHEMILGIESEDN